MYIDRCCTTVKLVYSASGLKSKLFVFLVLWHILLSISSITCHKRARFGENVAKLLLIPYICINHIENETGIIFQFCTQGFLGKVPNRFRTDFLNEFDLRTLIHIRCAI